MNIVLPASFCTCLLEYRVLEAPMGWRWHIGELGLHCLPASGTDTEMTLN